MANPPRNGPWGPLPTGTSAEQPPSEEATVVVPRPSAAATGLVSTDFHAAAARNKRTTLILIAVMIGIGAVFGYLIGATVEAGEGRPDFNPAASGLGFGFALFMIVIS
ncbi:MAG: hypothetical protein PHS60_17450, partial [Zavarzinia sp.]|nr:hypothetical protein [Zavarzinia sp.]